MTARSLHLGLNHVDPNAYEGWDGALSGCINDATDFHRLASSLGFSATMLTDAQATSYRLLQELSTAARECRSGDIFLVTYSGHGGQVPDATSEEQDNQDETWVCWDRQVVDDELYAIWAQFAAGVRIVVISDSCHSGTVVKMRLYEQLSASVARDAAALPTNGRIKAIPLATSMRIAERDKGMYDTVQFISGRGTRDRVEASLILISGCQDNQLSYDGDANGLFTGTFLRVWNNGAFQGSYRSLHRAILDQMPPYQTPNFLTVGAYRPEFEDQRPFTLAAPGGTVTPQPPEPTPPGPQPSRPVLRMGDSGAEVRQLQELLNRRGYALTADGFFGRATDGSVRQFQAANGLSADGIVGQQTWAALEGANTGVTPTQPTDTQPTDTQPTTQPTGGTGGTNRPTLRRGDSGQAVREMQTLLTQQGYYLTADGVFGPRTESLVKSFQRANGLVADGIVGQQTWVALERVRNRNGIGAMPYFA